MRWRRVKKVLHTVREYFLNPEPSFFVAYQNSLILIFFNLKTACSRKHFYYFPLPQKNLLNTFKFYQNSPYSNITPTSQGAPAASA